MTLDVEAIERDAHELIALADGFEASHEAVARRVRAFARDALDLLVAYSGERSGREAMQGNYQRALDVISSRAYATVVEHEHEPLASRAAPDDDNPFL